MMDFFALERGVDPENATENSAGGSGNAVRGAASETRRFIVGVALTATRSTARLLREREKNIG